MAKLYFKYGAMNSGKSTILLQSAHNYEERGMRTVLLKPMIDTKGADSVVSRLGVQQRQPFLDAGILPGHHRPLHRGSRRPVL